jgi:putative ABC transport system permease protein
MKNALFLAWKSLLWHRGRSITIVLSLAITIWLPVTVRLVMLQFEREVSARAQATPLVIGARGSRIDLALHSLYFETLPPSMTTMAEVEHIADSALGVAIPLHIQYRAQSRPGMDGPPIVGTSPEYFDFRGLEVAQGETFSLLGDCVLGARLADRMQLRPGDSLLSAPRNAFDLAGDYPLKMTITGILQKSYSPDDDAVFTDVRTTWVIAGIGHGHQELTAATDPSLLLDSKKGDPVRASAGVLPFTEITPDNISSFHFHGDPAEFPLSAIIVDPHSIKAQAQILGRYSSTQSVSQCLKPPEVVNELLSIVFRIEQLVWICSIAAVVVTGLLLSLVVNLSMRLRASEMRTMFQLGCSRRTIALLYGAEILLLLTVATVIAIVASWLAVFLASDVLRRLLF